jgi:hypothetical protein
MNYLLEVVINYAALISFFALGIDLVVQISRLYRRKSSQDISLRGITIRTLGTVVILIKFISLDDIYLIIGQATITIALIIYLAEIFYYRRSRDSS